MPTASPASITSSAAFGTLTTKKTYQPGSISTTASVASPTSVVIQQALSTALIEVRTYSYMTVGSSTPEESDAVFTLDIRAIPNIYLTMPDPAIRYGIPYIPKVRAHSNFTVTIDGNTDYPAPFNNTSGQMWQWDTTTLSAPPYNISDWAPNIGSLHWLSSGIYRPRVRERRDIVRSLDYAGFEELTTAKAIHLNHTNVEHMWLDLGASYSALTVIIVAQINDNIDDGHHLLDAGTATPIFSDVSSGGDHTIDDGLSYRAAIVVDPDRMTVGTDDRKNLAAGKHLVSKKDSDSDIRMYYAVFNGVDSAMGARSPGHKVRKEGKLSPANIRYLVMGRKRNRVSDESAAHATIYDVRIFDSALTEQQIKEQYRQIKTMYGMGRRTLKAWNYG